MNEQKFGSSTPDSYFFVFHASLNTPHPQGIPFEPETVALRYRRGTSRSGACTTSIVLYGEGGDVPETGQKNRIGAFLQTLSGTDVVSFLRFFARSAVSPP